MEKRKNPGKRNIPPTVFHDSTEEKVEHSAEKKAEKKEIHQL
nr:hypothetical protein [Ndongobacter massiliensis]